ncbi:MAG TPA: glycosyltransferase family A protein [Stellaceae bacterium]|nr:glycosyltransferase family A protein [Stellaceae bacterium]
MIVSVIVRTRNRTRFLARALASVAGQTYRDLDPVVINDGGDSAAFLETVERAAATFSARPRVIDRPSSAGAAAALNEALTACRGALVGIHDDDDTWHAGFVEAAVARYGAVKPLVPNLAGCICGLVRVYEKIDPDGEIQILQRETPGPENAAEGLVNFARYLLQQEDFYPIQCLFDKSAAVSAGGFDPGIEIFEDRHLFMRLLATGEFCVEPRRLACHHVRVDGQSGDAANASRDYDRAKFHFARLQNELLRGVIPGLPAGSAATLAPLLKAIADIRPAPARRSLSDRLRDRIARRRKRK